MHWQVVDYCGHRLVAQSIIPGILQGEMTSQLHYGSVDNGLTIKWDAEFHELLLQAARRLHGQEGVVADSTGDRATLCTPVECKGITGTDGAGNHHHGRNHFAAGWCRVA